MATHAKKAAPKVKRHNVTEMLYAFIGFLTTRDEPIIFSKKHNAGAISELLASFVKANNLPMVRDNYPKVKVPDGTDHLTNVAPMMSVAAEPLTPLDCFETLVTVLRRADQRHHDKILAAFLDRIKEQRLRDMQNSQRIRLEAEQGASRCEDRVLDFEKILRGDYLTITSLKEG